MYPIKWILLTLIGIGSFILFDRFTLPPVQSAPHIEDRIVISAPLQLILTGGDRFLAADMEAIRSAAAGPAGGETDVLYRIRAHRVASQLNPCHEDNYYLGSALLSWGGAADEGSDLLRRASECRIWDEVPPFFYGFNLHFFYKNDQEAARQMEIAAQRSPTNYAALRKTAIMITAGTIKDESAALTFLKNERNQARDPKLRLMLDKRIGRLEGLYVLRNAVQQFEHKFKRPVSSPQELLDSGVLDKFPTDPLGIGYVFLDGKFNLRQLKIEGLE